MSLFAPSNCHLLLIQALLSKKRREKRRVQKKRGVRFLLYSPHPLYCCLQVASLGRVNPLLAWAPVAARPLHPPTPTWRPLDCVPA